MIASYYPNTGWIRLDHDVLRSLADYKSEHGLTTWEETVLTLLGARDGALLEVLYATGLRVSEYTSLRADAIVRIGAGPWLHVPVGKLREDRYLPLHPQLVQLIDAYRSRHVPPDHQLLLPRENGRPLDRHTVTRFINKAGAAADLPHIHPHQLRHTLATQAINRGMSLEAIAAMLGHRSLDMTLRYAKIGNRTVAEEYFAVTDKVDADVYLLTDRAPALLPAPTGDNGLALGHSAPATDSLLEDLRSDRGMGWVPTSGWLTKVKIDASAPQLAFDLAIDASGAGAPSRIMAGLDLPGSTTPVAPDRTADVVRIAVGIALTIIGVGGILLLANRRRPPLSMA